jgi:hypothetical protein
MNVKQQTSLSPTDVGVDELPKVQDLPTVMVKSISYGPGYKENVTVAPGQKISDVLADGTIRDTVGYGNLKDANTMFIVNGKQVNPDYVVVGGEEIEIIKKAGEKA